MKWRLYLITILFCSAVISALSGTLQAEEPHIHIPPDSGIRLDLPGDSFSVHFSGKIQLQGRALLLSQRTLMGDAFEDYVSLLFQPDTGESDKLPRVYYSYEAEKPYEPLIELNFLQQEKLGSAIETIFGADIASQAGKHAFEIGKQGRLTLESFNTSVECDHRNYYADVVSFDSQQDMSPSQVHEMIEQISGCF